jgi:hypothetical protein
MKCGDALKVPPRYVGAVAALPLSTSVQRAGAITAASG